VPGVLVGLFMSFLPGFLDSPSLSRDLANFAWFTGVLVGGGTYRLIAAEESAAPAVAAAGGGAKVFP
jgi:NCS1 family nucleobase:cation symporter-1